MNVTVDTAAVAEEIEAATVAATDVLKKAGAIQVAAEAVTEEVVAVVKDVVADSKEEAVAEVAKDAVAEALKDVAAAVATENSNRENAAAVVLITNHVKEAEAVNLNQENAAVAQITNHANAAAAVLLKDAAAEALQKVMDSKRLKDVHLLKINQDIHQPQNRKVA